VEKEHAIQKIQRQLDELLHLPAVNSIDGEFKRWLRNTELAIEHVFGEGTRHLRDLRAIRWTPAICYLEDPAPEFRRAFKAARDRAAGVLRSMIDELNEYWGQFGTATNNGGADAISIVERICKRFHLVARQLRSRHCGRSTLEVEDEYDVQDLLHALLRIHFNDVRPEQWTPGHAGKSARVDFHLRQEGIVVEVKKTRSGLTEKDIGDQLIVDIGRYHSLPDCKKLICFVYDPEGRIGNPPSLTADLSKKHEQLDVLVIVAPSGE